MNRSLAAIVLLMALFASLATACPSIKSCNTNCNHQCAVCTCLGTASNVIQPSCTSNSGGCGGGCGSSCGSKTVMGPKPKTKSCGCGSSGNSGCSKHK